MDVIKQVQQAIVYIEDRLLEEYQLQALSDYVGLSPYHLVQSFKMIVGQSPSEYARARKLTLAAQDMMHGATRLIDVAKRYRYANANDFANDFSDFHGISPIQVKTKKDALQLQPRLYLKLTTTEHKPYTYRLEQMNEMKLVGYARYFDAHTLDYAFNIPDFLEDLQTRGHIKELQRYNDISPHELFVISCPLEDGLEIFIGVPSERYPAHLESRTLPARQYAIFNLQGEIDYATMEAWYYIESSLQLTLPYERNSLYVEVYPFDISFEDAFTKIQLWLPIDPDDDHI